MSGAAWRLFAAIDLPDAARAAVVAEVDALRRIGADVRWVPAAQLHLTLKFVGDLDPDAVPDLQRALRETPATGALELALAGLGRFPPPGKGAPRTFWAGCTGPGLPLLADLVAAIDGACAAHGVARERRSFTPHLTLGRVRSGRDLRALEAEVEARGPRFHVPLPALTTFRLYRSELRPEGAVHSVVEEFEIA